MVEKPLVFISCGQLTQAEKSLGSSIAALVQELTPFQPFFAEQESSLTGLVTNILGSLDRAAGFIAVMHPRGVVATPKDTHTRASVWVEQEIAIAAHLAHVQKRKLKVQTYAHTDIKLEGMREQLHLNPVRFADEQEVLEHLRTKLLDWTSFDNAALQLRPVVSPARHREGGIVELQLEIRVRNLGNTVVSEYHLDVEMPKPLLEGDSSIYTHELRKKATEAHRFFRFPAQYASTYPLYQDDEVLLLKLPMYVDRFRLQNPNLLDSSVKLNFYTKDSRVSICRTVSELLFGDTEIERFLAPLSD